MYCTGYSYKSWTDEVQCFRSLSWFLLCQTSYILPCTKRITPNKLQQSKETQKILMCVTNQLLLVLRYRNKAWIQANSTTLRHQVLDPTTPHTKGLQFGVEPEHRLLKLPTTTKLHMPQHHKVTTTADN
jgi:hypothetical protein